MDKQDDQDGWKADARRRRRLKRIRVTQMFATNLLRGDVGIVAGLPDDVTVDNIYRDDEKHEIVFTLHSKEFEPVPEGQLIPAVQGTSVSISFDETP